MAAGSEAGLVLAGSAAIDDVLFGAEGDSWVVSPVLVEQALTVRSIEATAARVEYREFLIP
ncbi:hypothetical protein VR010_12940 [Actinomycetaceae bacterium L2_0104]